MCKDAPYASVLELPYVPGSLYNNIYSHWKKYYMHPYLQFQILSADCRMQIINGQLCINDVLVAFESLELYCPTGSTHTTMVLNREQSAVLGEI